MAQLLSGLSVLVIDDFQSMRSTLQRMLEGVGATEIDMASDGQEAIARLESRSYDVVLCDDNLGIGKDGRQILEEAKQHRLLGPTTVFVMVTAENSTEEMAAGAVDYKADDFLTKPFTKELLYSRLQKVIARKVMLAPIETAREKGDVVAAVAECDRLLDEGRGSRMELLRHKLEAQLDGCDWGAAEATCREVLKSRDIPWARFGWGRARYWAGDWVGAQAVFEELVTDYRTFLAGYDWLALTLNDLGEPEKAQSALQIAAQSSPRAVRRQSALGALAERNGDYRMAEKAYRRAVYFGRNSVFRAPSHYVRLAQAQLKNGCGSDAVITLRQLREDFVGDKGAELWAATGESALFHALGQVPEAQQAFQQVERLYEGVEVANADPELLLEVAKSYLLFGRTLEGQAVMRAVISSNPDDSALLERVQQAFIGADCGDAGEMLIAQVVGEAAELNERGEQLVKQGEIEQAIAFFEQAAATMPNNPTINLNMARVLLMKMQRDGTEQAALGKAHAYLERARREGDAEFAKLCGLYRTLSRS